ncbi:MAG: hypothetical protein ABR609_07180 [Acidimicrobiia bacterium]
MTLAKRSEFPALRHVVLLIPWMVVGLVARLPIRDNSFLWHVRAGTLQIDAGEVLVADPFSFNSPDILWRTQSWLAELAYGWLEGLFGLNFVWALNMSVGVLLLITIGLVFRQQSKSMFWMAGLLAASAFVIAPYLNPRPSLFSLLFFVLTLLVALEHRLWWTLPLISWVWAAVHGGWPLGVLFVLLWAIYQRNWRLGQQIVPMSVAALFTAHGWGVLEILIDFIRARESLGLITEWAPTNLGALSGFIFLLGLLIALIGRPGGQRPTWRALWFLVPFLYLAVSSARSLPFGWLALIPLVALAAAGVGDPRILRSESPGRRLINSVIGLTVLSLPFLLARNTRLDPEHFPIEASRQLVSDRVFHDDTTGGFLIYAYGPDRQVYIDDRAELFGQRVADFIKTRNAGGDWEAELTSMGIEEALIKEADPLAEALVRSGWNEKYSDETFVILVAPGVELRSS